MKSTSEVQILSPQKVRTIATIGHGTRELAEVVAMLTAAKVKTLVDVRQFPGSRRNPQFTAAPFAAALGDAGIAYVHLAGLGGRRRADPASRHTALRIPAFRAYADHLTTSAFTADYVRLREIAAGSPTAIMCAERLWWRCHRRLIADRLTVDGWSVTHLLEGKKQEPHRMWGTARVEGGALIYDQVGTAGADGAETGEGSPEGSD